MSIAKAFDDTTATHTASRIYEIRDHLTVELPADGTRQVALWLPIIPDSPGQRILDLEVDAPGAWKIHRERDYGNMVLYASLTADAGTSQGLQLRYQVERMRVVRDLDPDRVGPLSTPELFRRELGPERYVNVDASTHTLARDLVGQETNILRQARLLYDYVTGAMAYDAAQQSWKGSTAHAMTCSVGNCNDIHALFISLCRACGIPARLVLGQALEPPPPGEEACDLCGYHCWAEFFAPGLGWLPADASCACKYGTHGLFGDLEMNHIAWSTGRDLTLTPPQQGEPVLFFAGPYAEAAGQPYGNVQRGITFDELGEWRY